jgi:hypothetical protein
MPEDYYTTLGAHRKASAEEIGRAYRELARKYHPDLNPGDPEAERKFEEVQAAFEVLSDPEQRAAYNRLNISFKTTRLVPSSFSHVPWTPPARGRMKDRIAAKKVSLPAGLLVFHAGIRIYIEPMTMNLQLASRHIVGVGTQHEHIVLRAFVLFTLAFAVLELVGAINMAALRRSTLAVAGALMAIFPSSIIPIFPARMSFFFFKGIPLETWSLVVSTWCFIGIPIGIWSVVVLRRPEVRDAFRQ